MKGRKSMKDEKEGMMKMKDEREDKKEREHEG